MIQERAGPKNFYVHALIGKGSFGEVFLVKQKTSSKFFAMKVLNKEKIMRQNLVKYALTERNVLSLTDHPFIVRLHAAFQTSEKLFLILDYCNGGDLAKHLQKEKRFSEERAKFYIAEITLALENLHKRDIIFRDLKPDNIVIDSEGHAMLTDFGLSKEGVLQHHTGAESFCGSVAYLAPEMLKRCGHGKAVDWYLLGVLFYEMLVGVPPYYSTSREKMFVNIQKAPLKIPNNLSSETKDL
jgi:serine/threonine protein kinase